MFARAKESRNIRAKGVTQKVVMFTQEFIISIWASSRKNLSSGCLKNLDSNRSSELQRLARILKFCLKQV